ACGILLPTPAALAPREPAGGRRRAGSGDARRQTSRLTRHDPPADQPRRPGRAPRTRIQGARLARRDAARRPAAPEPNPPPSPWPSQSQPFPAPFHDTTCQLLPTTEPPASIQAADRPARGPGGPGGPGAARGPGDPGRTPPLLRRECPPSATIQ